MTNLSHDVKIHLTPIRGTYVRYFENSESSDSLLNPGNSETALAEPGVAMVEAKAR
jgi:hypothetical protein